MNTISVIIPMYNAEKTIQKTLDSVLEQTYPAHYQIIVINDGSSDNSLNIVKQYKSEHENADILLIDKPNGGVSSARNAGMRAATGEWIALLDSDDQWLPNKMEIQMKILEQHPKIDLIGSNINQEQTRILWKLKDRLMPIKTWELFIKWHPATPTLVFRRSILDEVGYYNESLRYAEDEELLLRICINKSCWFTPEQLVFCGEGKPTFGHSGLSGNLRGMQEGQRFVLKQAYKKHIINLMQYLFYRLYAEIKYWRRIFIVWKRKLNK